MYGRKPRQAKQTPSDKHRDEVARWTVNASIAKNAHAIAASVAARPSMLSSRLKAFVIPTSQTTPSAVARIGSRRSRRGRRTRERAPPRLPARRLRERRKVGRRRRRGRRGRGSRSRRGCRRARGSRGSRRPRGRSRRRRACRRRCRFRRASGVERVCQRSSCGAATTRRAAGVCRSPQIVRKLAGSAARAATATVTAQCYSSGCLLPRLSVTKRC